MSKIYFSAAMSHWELLKEKAISRQKVFIRAESKDITELYIYLLM